MKDNMKVALVVGAAILSVLSACNAPAPTENTTVDKPTPPFSFKKLHVGMPLEEAKANGLVKGCGKQSNEDIICNFTDERIGDLVIYDFQNSVYFDSKGFNWFYVRVHHSKFDQIAGDLT